MLEFAWRSTTLQSKNGMQMSCSKEEEEDRCSPVLLYVIPVFYAYVHQAAAPPWNSCLDVGCHHLHN